MLEELLFELEDRTLLKTVIEDSEYSMYMKKLKKYIELNVEEDMNLTGLILEFCEEELIHIDAMADVIKKDKAFVALLSDNCWKKNLLRDFGTQADRIELQVI